MAGPQTPDQIIAALKAGAFGSAAPTTTAPTSYVYMGEQNGPVDSAFSGKKVADDGVESDRIENHPAVDKAIDVDTAASSIYGWSEKRLKSWEQTLLDNGLIKPGQYNYEDLVSKWKAAVDGASNLYAAGKKVTPAEYVKLYVGSNGIGGDGSDSGGPKTTTQTSYQTVDDQDARAAATDAYSSLMGRAPKGKESEAIHAMLQAYADNHPSISTQTTDGKGNTTSHSSGGMSSAAAGQMVEDQAKTAPDYAEYQASTVYFNALQSALGATAQVG